MRKVKILCSMFALKRILKPRRTHLYCVGTAKSGTHSIAAILEDQLRTCHEAERELLIRTILDLSDGRIDREQLALFVKERDKRLWLEVDSSQLNYFLLDALLEEFEGARFILTMRDCYSWLDSFINHQLAQAASQGWKRLRDLRFRPNQFQYGEEEKILKEHGLYTLDGYLSYWAMHNRNVLGRVPSDRLLVIRTHEITQNIEKIAAVAGVPHTFVNHKKSHSFRAKARFNVPSKIDSDYLETKVDLHCRDLLGKYFPMVQSARDVFPETSV